MHGGSEWERRETGQVELSWDSKWEDLFLRSPFLFKLEISKSNKFGKNALEDHSCSANCDESGNK